MTLAAFYDRLRLDARLAQEAGFNPYYRHLQSGLNDPVRLDGREFLNLAANDYLGLAADPRVGRAIAAAVARYGASLCGTPIATGCVDLLRALEQRLAAFVGLEDGVVLPSCYQANNGLFSAVAGKEDVILIDHYAHSSLIEGAKAVGCKIRPFLHNDVEHLASLLGKVRGHRQAFVVTESVFSTEGSIAPLAAMVEVCERFGAVPVVDDSHGIGVLGANGRGVLEHFGLTDFPGIYTASLGKALANAGGLIAGRRSLIEHLRYFCPHLIYSTALPPGVAAGVEAVLDILAAEFPARRRLLWEHRDTLRRGLTAAGFTVMAGEAPINSVLAGSAVQTLRLARAFYEAGLLTTPFVYPSVPLSEGRVRLIAGAGLTLARVQAAVAALPAIARAWQAAPSSGVA
ncbi:MAG: 2-amino-3-ketobutyrate coenzyme A ligase [Candidatus Ozemobacter sibiricus]|jgi:7-keto-8-aminopelargonate synthetase-like enzyme|uniref:2-amino-3-ketobutyrate coenzyme A ligase n=1 Tax=Candidatus Ozemobacter sibiricus TaxID=2268124 RepID=A0A367ZQE4_9BACT|nr:MAG: 2-amino-3-ketobutyrate coenzyme A ligase [Candidatus Ozemobacter sibiricus]